jgi:SAM-dependent methyltransferase
MPETFDYEAVTWGGGGLVSATAPDFLDHSLHLHYALEALRDVTGQVVEVGCGSARFIASVAAARPDLFTHGCDLSRTALREGLHHRQTRLVAASAEHLPYASKSMGAVLMIDVLEHLPQMDVALAEVKRVLADGAPFHLVFPCEGSKRTLHGKSSLLRGLKRKHAGHVQQIDPQALFKTLEHSGFRLDDVRYSYHPLGQLYDLAVFGALGLGVDMHGARRSRVEQAGFSPLKLARTVISRVLYAESRLLSKVPLGMTVHVTSR